MSDNNDIVFKFCEDCECDSEEEEVEWSEEQFCCGDCGFCGKPNDGWWIEGDEDAICEECAQVWEYISDDDVYRKIKDDASVNDVVASSDKISSHEAFAEWFDENIKSLEDCDNEELDFVEVIQEWCKDNNHEWTGEGVLNNNI